VSHARQIDCGSSTHQRFASSAGGGGTSRSAPVSSAASAAASRSVGDTVSEQERRELLESMNPGSVRSLAASMPVIEQAKGIVMGCYGCDATAAFAVLVRLSSTRNVKLRDLADRVVEAASRQDDTAPGSQISPIERVRRLLQDGAGEERP
jgi:hypothetical protein